jgi:hypothetical protein
VNASPNFEHSLAVSSCVFDMRPTVLCILLKTHGHIVRWDCLLLFPDQSSNCYYSLATMVTRTRLDVTLYVHFLYCFSVERNRKWWVPFVLANLHSFSIGLRMPGFSSTDNGRV